MKKSIFYLAMALVTFTNFAVASTGKPSTSITAAAPTTATPLCIAISKGDVVTVKKFIEYGANVNEISNDMTPLMVASRYNNVEIIEILLSKGSDLYWKNTNGVTALQCATMSNAKDAVALLRQKGAKK